MCKVVSVSLLLSVVLMESSILMKCERNVQLKLTQLKLTHFPNFLRKIKQDAYFQGAGQAVTKTVIEVQRKSPADESAVPVAMRGLSSERSFSTSAHP